MQKYGVLLVIVCLVKIVALRKWTEGDVRLVGGPRRYMGTVVILHNGKWGSVCDDHWEIQDASVVCRQLGYTLAIRAATRSEFGLGNRRFWLSQVHCKGNEQRLDECPFQGYNESTSKMCPGRYRSAGVVCSAAVATSTISFSGNAVFETSTANEKVERKALTSTKRKENNLKNRNKMNKNKVQKRPKTNSISTFGTLQTALLTRETTSVPSTTLEATRSTEALHVSSMPIVTKPKLQSPSDMSSTTTSSTPLYLTKENEVANFIASGNSTYKESKELLFYNEGHFSYSSNKSVKEAYQLCNMTNLRHNETTDGCEVYFADDPRAENLEIRLMGGRYEWEGHVQVKTKAGAWGAICSDHWTLREAMVVCQQLGVYGKAKQALLTSYFGGMDVSKIIYRIKCVGRESTLASCNLTWSDYEHTCSKKTAVAGVTCSQHLPDLIPSLREIEDSMRLQDQPLYYLRCAMEENCLATSAYLIKNTSLTWRNNMRRLLRFSTIVHNRGLADFRPYRPRGQWEWHACHMHYHSMEVFAHYDIIDAKGTRLAEGSKASFCLEDTTCDKGVRPQYNCRGFADQGLSVNCSDNYLYDIDCQWIDISDIKPGEYTFLLWALMYSTNPKEDPPNNKIENLSFESQKSVSGTPTNKTVSRTGANFVTSASDNKRLSLFVANFKDGSKSHNVGRREQL